MSEYWLLVLKINSGYIDMFYGSIYLWEYQYSLNKRTLIHSVLLHRQIEIV